MFLKNCASFIHKQTRDIVNKNNCYEKFVRLNDSFKSEIHQQTPATQPPSSQSKMSK